MQGCKRKKKHLRETNLDLSLMLSYNDYRKVEFEREILTMLAYQKPKGEDDYPIGNMQRSKLLSQF